MRKIKFRIWDKEEKSFTEEPYWRWTIANNGYLYNSENDEWHETSDKYEVSLFTGLKDKNGKEIYEGDLLRGDGTTLYKAVICKYWIKGFQQYGFNLKVNYNPKHIEFSDMEFDLSILEKIEVIGNVHENPELLK